MIINEIYYRNMKFQFYFIFADNDECRYDNCKCI